VWVDLNVSTKMAGQMGSKLAGNVPLVAQKWAKDFPFVRNGGKVGLALRLSWWSQTTEK
jgi:hypothetical protein